MTFLEFKVDDGRKITNTVFINVDYISSIYVEIDVMEYRVVIKIADVYEYRGQLKSRDLAIAEMHEHVAIIKGDIDE